MHVVVPFAAERPKTRLSGVFTCEERQSFARAMLDDVLDAVQTAGHDPTVLATAPLTDADGTPVSVEASAGVTESADFDGPMDTNVPTDAAAPIDADAPTGLDASEGVDAPVTVDSQPLSSAVNALLTANDEPVTPVAVLMSDLALATPESIRRLMTPPEDVVVAPGRGGGTNALVVRHPDFRVDYHGASYLDHLRVARDIGASVREVDSFRLATDIDEEADLAEVLIHSSGKAHDWLRDVGCTLDVRDGRVGVRRE